MSTIEPIINAAICELLKGTRSAWRSPDVAFSETTQTLIGGGQPDILVDEPNTSPVVLETEVVPAASVESDALSRLGRKVSATGIEIVSSIAVRLPDRLRTKQDAALREELSKARDLEMALYTGGDETNCLRWPQSGWLSGGIAELSILIQGAALPPVIIKKASEDLVAGVIAATGQLGRLHRGTLDQIGQSLCQEDSEQTRGMAATILVNAFVFQETLAGGPLGLADVRSLQQLRQLPGSLSQFVVMDEWRKILKVNYWPIFDIACRILEIIPAFEAGSLISCLAECAENMLHQRLMSSHDLTGAVFQRLIADRKFLAAFYTTPEAAALLAGLAIRPERTPAGGSWANADDLKALRIADFACGTGTLLTTAYRRVGQLHELTGGNAEVLHPDMMGRGITGCDILPAAAHLTASMLAGTHPTITYPFGSVLTVAYGKQPDKRPVALGSLELLDTQRNIQSIGITARVAGSMGETEANVREWLPHAAFDLVIMNPPFTRPTNHAAKRASPDFPNPMFAAFRSSKQEQQDMGDEAKRLTVGTCAHGNAGEASIFLALADRKLKPGGVLALVMPLSLVAGEAWESSRTLLRERYSELVVVSIAATGQSESAFSADTGMGECLVVARKSSKGSNRATFVVLSERPEHTLLGASAADQICRLIGVHNLRRLEEGPVGGNGLHFGDELIGHVLDAPLPHEGSWHVARISDLSLAQAAYQLALVHRIWLPTMHESEAVDIPMTTVASIGEIGPLHRDINGEDSAAGTIRGPFDILPLTVGSQPSYPVLWAHDADRERTMTFGADCEAQPRSGSSRTEQKTINDKAARIWATASHCHFNLDCRFNSQSTAMQFTSSKTIGGRAWMSIILPSVDQEKTSVLWANTSLGLLLHWWHANKQQSGRGCIGKSGLHSLPVLDVTKLSPGQVAASVDVFDEMSTKPLLPVNEMDKDPVRKELDERFARDVLGLPEPITAPGGPLELLRSKLSCEPSIHGGKGMRKRIRHENKP